MEIHQLDATDLLDKLNRRELTSVQIVTALFDRADKVEGKINSLTVRYSQRALEDARRADDERSQGKSLGPLHGLPITIKESVSTAGDEISLGVEARKGMCAEEDAVVVRLLKEAGAIPIAKTNISQLMLFHESDNPVFGATKNPWSLAHVPGGSSGGEAAAIAAGITPWGVGTDIGGSIRVPAAFTGTAGLKPTVDRWSNLGCVAALSGQEVVRGQIGPMARTARDVSLLFRAINSKAHAKYDPVVPPHDVADPFEVDIRNLTIGYFSDDGFIRASSSLTRAVEKSASMMEELGAKLVKISPQHQSEIMDTYFGALSSDGGASVRKHLAGGTVSGQLKPLSRIAGMPNSGRKVLSKVARFSRQTRVARLLEVVGEKAVFDYWQLTAQRAEIRARVYREWREQGIDAVICPAYATPAIRHGQSDDFSMAGSYSMRYNFLNFPGGVVPISRVGKTDAVRADTLQRLEKKAADVEEHSAGLPLGVQVVGRPFEEDVVLAIMMALEAKAKKENDFPVTPVESIEL
ncbi:MAG: amidase family protein [Myxococcota bacterium]|nr:amidase family protein [Myxococcota bacterium]